MPVDFLEVVEWSSNQIQDMDVVLLQLTSPWSWRCLSRGMRPSWPPLGLAGRHADTAPPAGAQVATLNTPEKTVQLALQSLPGSGQPRQVGSSWPRHRHLRPRPRRPRRTHANLPRRQPLVQLRRLPPLRLRPPWAITRSRVLAQAASYRASYDLRALTALRRDLLLQLLLALVFVASLDLGECTLS